MIERKKRRLLLITKDADILETESASHRRIFDLQDVFLEVHVVVLNRKERNANRDTQRLSPNVWVHATNSSSWWRLSYDAYRVAETELIFSGSLRADVIVAEDVCEAGLVGLLLSKKHNIPLQLHIYERDMDTTSKQHSLFQALISSYLFRQATSIRTETESRRDAMSTTSQNPQLKIDVLPHYYDVQTWSNFISMDSLHNKYPQYKTVIVHIARALESSSEIMNGVVDVLREHPSVGIVIVGDGIVRPQLERQAIALRIQNQIEFEPMPKEILSLLKAADILLHVVPQESEDEIVLMSGIIGLPVVTYGASPTEGISAYMCEKGDISCIAQSLQGYLHADASRRIVRIQDAYESAMEKSRHDRRAYSVMYAESIERCMDFEG